jgi:hypothetical protein
MLDRRDDATGAAVVFLGATWPRSLSWHRVKTVLLVVVLLLAPLRLASAEIAIVLNSLDDDISLLETTTYQPVKRIPVGKEPHHLMATADDRYLIVASTMSNDLVFLDPRTGEIVKRVSRISDPYQIGFSPSYQWFVAASLRLDRIDIYEHRRDAEQPRRQHGVGHRPAGAPGGRHDPGSGRPGLRGAAAGRQGALGHVALDQPGQRDRHGHEASREEGVRATFFVSNERTTRGDRALDASWAPYWKARVAEGHAFGNRPWSHHYVRRDTAQAWSAST